MSKEIKAQQAASPPDDIVRYIDLRALLARDRVTTGGYTPVQPDFGVDFSRGDTISIEEAIQHARAWNQK